MAASIRHARTQPPATYTTDLTVSILKPLAGLDEGLEGNLRSFFEQEYQHFELLFAVRHEWDLAVPVVRRLMAEFPRVAARLIFTGEPPYPHLL